MEQKVIVILGQTATGKSNLAVKIAKKINGEIKLPDAWKFEPKKSEDGSRQSYIR